MFHVTEFFKTAILNDKSINVPVTDFYERIIKTCIKILMGGRNKNQDYTTK